MKINDSGVSLIKKWEGLGDGNLEKPRLQPYMDPVGIWTIGWGHAITVNGRFIRGPAQKALAYDLYDGGISIKQAQELLRMDLRRFELAVQMYCTVPPKQHEFNAFVSLAFNIGVGGFKRSSALREHNRGNKHLVPAKIKLWNKAGGKVLRGLSNRRAEEAKVYSGR